MQFSNFLTLKLPLDAHSLWHTGIFLTEEEANSFSVNLQSGLRLLFAERYTHMRGSCREKLGRAQQGMVLFGTSQWVSITALQLGKPGRDRALTALPGIIGRCPQSAVARNWPHMNQQWQEVSSSALLAMYDKPNDGLSLALVLLSRQCWIMRLYVPRSSRSLVKSPTLP